MLVSFTISYHVQGASRGFAGRVTLFFSRKARIVNAIRSPAPRWAPLLTRLAAAPLDGLGAPLHCLRTRLHVPGTPESCLPLAQKAISGSTRASPSVVCGHRVFKLAICPHSTSLPRLRNHFHQSNSPGELIMHESVCTFGKSVVIGLSIAAPVGPIGLLCIRNTLQHGWLRGLCCGLGAATADSIYGLLAACGVASLVLLLPQFCATLKLCSGAYLVYLGLSCALKKPQVAASLPVSLLSPTLMSGEESGDDKVGKRRETATSERSLWRKYLTTLLLTLGNPLTITSFLAVYSACGVSSTCITAANAAVVVAGVFAGSALWWLCLSFATDRLRCALPPDHLRLVDIISGALLTVLGIVSLMGA